MLLKIKNDMKVAMRQKDKNRLNVLKGLVSDYTNASKTAKPIRTDIQMLSMLRKKSENAKNNAQGFQAASRQDLVDKEQAEAAVLDEYAGTVQTISNEDIEAAVKSVIEDMNAKQEKLDKGTVLKRLIAPGGVFDGKPVEKPVVSQLVHAAFAK